MRIGIPSFSIPKLFGWNESKTSEKIPADTQAFVGYPFAGGTTKERLPNDLELNDYATHQQGVLNPAIESANRRNSRRRAFINQLFKKKTPDNMAATVAAPQKDMVSFQDVDYVEIYKKGSKNLKKKLEKAGVKIPTHIAMGFRTFAEDEHVKNNVTTKYNNRKIRDDDPMLKSTGVFFRRARANKEKELITYKNIRQFACHKVMVDVKTISTLFKTADNGKDLTLNATSVDELNDWFKKNFSVTLRKSEAKASKKAFQSALGKRPANLKLIESELRRHFDLLISKVPFGNEIKELAGKLKQEALDQTRYAEKNVRQFSLEDGSVCERVSDNEFKLTRPYGTDAKELRFTKRAGDQNFTLELHSVDRAGNRTAIALDNENAWSELQQHFDKTSVLKTLFGDGSNLHKTGFDALYGRLKANEMIEEKITDFVNQPIKDVLDERLENCTAFHGTGFSYNGAHYGENLGIESRSVVMGLIHKKAMNGDLAVNGSCGFQQDLLWHSGGHIIAIQDITGKTFLDSEHGNDPYTVEEKVTWQSIKPDTATAGVYEIPEGRKTVPLNREPSRENPIPHMATPDSLLKTDGDTLDRTASRWRPRDVAVLSIPMRTIRNENGNELVEERPLLITHKGQPVIASSALTLKEAKDAKGFSLHLHAIAIRHDLDTLVLKHELPEGTALADDEGNHVKDEDGNPVRLLEKVVVERRRVDGRVQEAQEDAAGNPTFKGGDFEITSIERWIRIPLSDNKGGVKTDKTGQVLCTYKKELQDTNPNPEILRDRHFSTINCVHTQNGLDVPHVQLAPGVEIVSHSVKPADNAFDRSFIPAASKANPNPHPVHVPENTAKQSMIVEAMEIHKGNRTIGRTTQHHIDMLKEEGGMRMNPYYAGRYKEQLDKKYIGHREGNVEAIETGNYVRQTKEMFAELNNVFQPFNAEAEPRNIKPSSLNEGAKERNDALFNRYREGPRKLIYDLFARNDIDKEQCVRQLQKLVDGISDSEVTEEIAVELKVEISQALETWANIQAGEQTETAQTSAPSHARNVKAIDGNPILDALSDEILTEVEVDDEQAEALTTALQSAFDSGNAVRQAASIEYLVNSGLVDHWEDVQGTAAKVEKLTQFIKSPEATELRALLEEVQADHAAIERMSSGLSAIQETLATAKGDDTQKTRTELQRYFRSYPGWSLPAGVKAGAAMGVPIGSYFHSVAEASTGGLTALGAATGAFAPLLIAIGIEQGKNAHIALRRLKEAKEPYKDYLNKLRTQKAELETFGRTMQASLSGDTGKEDLLTKAIADIDAQLQKMQSTTTNRLKVINQQINDQKFNAWTSPLLPLSGIAAGTNAVASALPVGTVAGAVAGVAATVAPPVLTTLGLANIAKTGLEYRKIRKIDKQITRLNLGEDSNLRLNFNTFEQNKKKALEFQLGNWSVFTASSGLLIAVPFTGPAAPILGAVAGTALAASTVVAFILPKREWRGRTMRAGENTTHINSDFLSTERRKNRLCANLFNQLGMQQNIIQKIVDRAIDGDNKFDTPAWKQFRYTFEQNRSLRWLYTDADKKILSKAISEHLDETKDLQFDLMLRSTDHEINYMTFQVNERTRDVAKHTASIAQLKEFAKNGASSIPLVGALESGLQTMVAGLEQEKTRLQALNDLRTKLRDFSQYQNKDWSPETMKEFDKLRMRYMVAHDLLIDSMDREEIKRLVQVHEKAGSKAQILTARFGDHTYEGKNAQIIGKKEKLKNIQFEYSDKAFEFLMENVDKINNRFVHMMCYSIPEKLSYEVNAVMNIYEEEIKQRIKDISKEKAGAASGKALKENSQTRPDNGESQAASTLAVSRRGILRRKTKVTSSGQKEMKKEALTT